MVQVDVHQEWSNGEVSLVETNIIQVVMFSNQIKIVEELVKKVANNLTTMNKTINRQRFSIYESR